MSGKMKVYVPGIAIIVHQMLLMAGLDLGSDNINITVSVILAVATLIGGYFVKFKYEDKK